MSQKTAGQYKGTNVDLLQGPIMLSLVTFMLPILGSNLFQTLYNTVDTMIVGNVLGELSLAAMGAASPVYMLLICMATGTANGMSIVTARIYGAGQEEKVRKAVGNALVIGLGMGFLITVLSQLVTRPLLILMNTPENIIDEAQTYIRIVTLFALVTLAYNLGSGLLRAIGDSVTPLVFLIISSLLNIVLDFYLIKNAGMGIAGAAVATVISQGVSVLLCVIYIIRKVPLLIPAAEDLVPEKELFTDLLSQGISMGLMSCIVDIGTVVLQYGINGMGEYIIAGQAASRKLFQMFNLPIFSMSAAVSTFVSQNRGAGQPGRIRRAMRDVVIYLAIYTVFTTVIACLFGTWLVHTISGSDNAILLNYGTRYMQLVSPFYVILGIVLCFRFALQGLGMKIIPLFSSLIELVGKIIFVLLLIPVYRETAVILCEPVIWCFMGTFLLIVFYTNPFIRKSADAKTDIL